MLQEFLYINTLHKCVRTMNEFNYLYQDDVARNVVTAEMTNQKCKRKWKKACCVAQSELEHQQEKDDNDYRNARRILKNKQRSFCTCDIQNPDSFLKMQILSLDAVN